MGGSSCSGTAYYLNHQVTPSGIPKYGEAEGVARIFQSYVGKQADLFYCPSNHDKVYFSREGSKNYPGVTPEVKGLYRLGAYSQVFYANGITAAFNQNGTQAIKTGYNFLKAKNIPGYAVLVDVLDWSSNSPPCTLSVHGGGVNTVMVDGSGHFVHGSAWRTDFMRWHSSTGSLTNLDYLFKTTLPK